MTICLIGAVGCRLGAGTSSGLTMGPSEALGASDAGGGVAGVAGVPGSGLAVSGGAGLTASTGAASDLPVAVSGLVSPLPGWLSPGLAGSPLGASSPALASAGPDLSDFS